MRPVRLGTRGSTLALRQAGIAVAALTAAAPGLAVQVVKIRTEGDRRRDLSLGEVGGQGVFVKDIQGALLGGEIDLAVHSLKDMPAATPDGLTIAACLPRGDVRDALVSTSGRPLAALPAGARIGTDSRRRAAQLLALRPDIRPDSIRGNVDTRVAKAASGEYDAVVLALVGLERLAIEARAAQVFTVEEMLPAPGQGILAIEARADATDILDLAARIDDADARAAATAERAYLQRLGAGCRLPVAAYAEPARGRLRLRGLLADASGRLHRHEMAGLVADAGRLGAELAARLMAAAGVEAAP
jgi:hydroxymethylbilane synthase